MMGYPLETSGVITGRRSNGFYLQEKNGTFDGTNSLAIYVFTSSTPPIAAAVGEEVYVTGTLAQYPAGATAAELELTGVTIKNYVGTAPLPDPIEIVPDSTLTQSAQFEKYAGMLARIANTKVTGPTNTTGAFYVTAATAPRPFREPGVEVGLQLPTGAGANVPRYDGNPEVVRVDMNGCVLPADVATGDTVGDLVGNLGYYYSSTYGGAYSLYTCVTGTTSQHAAALPTPSENEFSIASFNMWNFTASATQLAKASLEIRNILKMPDIIGVEEMLDQTSLQAVADRVNSDAQALGLNPNYRAQLGKVAADQNIGFLYRADRITNPTFTVLADGSKMAGTCSSYNLWDRQPFQMDATVTLPGRVQTPITVLVNHLRSLISVELNDNTGYCTRLKRSLEAEALATILGDMQTEGRRLITLGDMNAFDFNDGYVDVMGALTGNPAPESEVTLVSKDKIDPNLTDLIKSWPDKAIYTYVENGSAQSLDHIVVNDALLALPHRVEVAHVNADFPLAFSADATRPERISDHDQPVVYFTIPKNNNAPVANGQSISTPESVAVPVTLTASDPDGDTVTYSIPFEPTHGILSGTAPNITYTPNSGYAGADSFTFQALDSSGAAGYAVVHLNIIQIAPTVGPSTLTFANQTVNSTSSSLFTTLINNSSAPLVIGTLSASGDFSVSLNGCPASVAAHATCRVFVNFKPTESGIRSGVLAINSSAVTKNVALSGNGVGSLTISPAAVTFADQAVNTYSSSQRVAVINNTGADVAIDPVASANFGVSLNGCPASLPNSFTCYIYVQFHPTIAGTLTGTLSAGSASIALAGTATGILRVSAASLTFASQAVNTYSSSQLITVTNNTGSVVSFTPTASANFGVSLNGCPASLANGASCNVFVQFRPKTAGLLTGTLTVGTATVSLTGNSTGTLSVNASSLTFAPLSVNAYSSSQMVTVTNNTGTPVSLTPTASANFRVSLNGCPASLANAASCNVYVQFHPASVGVLSGTLSVGSASVSLSGTAE